MVAWWGTYGARSEELRAISKESRQNLRVLGASYFPPSPLSDPSYDFSFRFLSVLFLFCICTCILVSVHTTHNLPFHHFFPISSLSAFPMSSSHVTGVCLSSSACFYFYFYSLSYAFFLSILYTSRIPTSRGGFLHIGHLLTFQVLLFPYMEDKKDKKKRLYGHSDVIS